MFIGGVLDSPTHNALTNGTQLYSCKGVMHKYIITLTAQKRAHKQINGGTGSLGTSHDAKRCGQRGIMTKGARQIVALHDLPCHRLCFVMLHPLMRVC